ncbi:hypothetical protein BDZ89DRAFT_1048266 [Hymenopellis radicata]|nr:hypothetical protein BDZ89DRAFT_1048266 [Hymenopellis radicata]
MPATTVPFWECYLASFSRRPQACLLPLSASPIKSSMTTITTIINSFTFKTDITTVLHNYLDDFNRNRPCLETALNPFKASYDLEIKKEKAEDDSSAKATMPRSSFDAILAALPALSADGQSSDVVIHKRYRLLFYSSLPHLTSCLFFKGLLVVPEDATFNVLYLLWCYTEQNPSRLRYLVDAICVHLPSRLVFCFLRVAKRSAPNRPSTSPTQPMSVSSFGPNARCSYLARSGSCGSGFQRKSLEALEAEPPVLSKSRRPPSSAMSSQLPLASKTYDTHLRPDLDNYARFPRTSSITSSARASSLFKKRKHLSPSSPPRKKISRGIGKENEVIGLVKERHHETLRRPQKARSGLQLGTRM